MPYGCDWDKPRFTVFMHGKDVRLPFLERGCEICKNHKTQKCEECRHWSGFERKEQGNV